MKTWLIDESLTGFHRVIPGLRSYSWKWSWGYSDVGTAPSPEITRIVRILGTQTIYGNSWDAFNHELWIVTVLFREGEHLRVKNNKLKVIHCDSMSWFSASRRLPYLTNIHVMDCVPFIEGKGGDEVVFGLVLNIYILIIMGDICNIVAILKRVRALVFVNLN